MKTSRADDRGSRFLAGSGALVMGACVAGFFPAVAQDPKAAASTTKPEPAPEEEIDPSELVNWVEFGIGANFLDGNRGQFRQQNGTPATGAYGGIQGFHFELPFDQKGLFTVDGRGIVDNGDYSIRLGMAHPDKGYVRIAHVQYRTYYDVTAGYLPNGNVIFKDIFENDLAIDRSLTTFEAGLTLPDKPKVTFRYDLQTREGDKSSTIWGLTTLTPGAAQKRITPAVRDIDEVRHIFALDVKHDIGNTEVGIGGRYEVQETDNGRRVVQQPNEGARSRLLTTTEGIDVNLGNFHAYSDTRLSEQWRFTTGYSFTTLHSVLSGDRINTAIVTPLAATDTRYANLQGGSDLKQHIANINLMYSPSTNWYFVPSLRIERQGLDGDASANPITGTATQTVSNDRQFANNDRGALYVAEALDVRYVGIKNWAFYGRAELSQDRADLKEQFGTNTLTAATIFRSTDWERLLQKYSVGANWYPSTKVNLAGQYYHRISENDYTNEADSTSNALTSNNRYPAFLGKQTFEVDCVNFRVTWKPLPRLTLVSRYDYQISRAYTEPEQLAPIESARNERHMFGETLSWTPLNWLYAQAFGNYVLDTTHSPVEDVTGAMSGVILSAPNDYWIAGGTLGFVLDPKTDLQTSYSHYAADNYVDNSSVSIPYGSGARHDEVSSTLVRKISERVRWTLRYAYTQYRDETSGGAMNYTAHGILSTVQYRF